MGWFSGSGSSQSATTDSTMMVQLEQQVVMMDAVFKKIVPKCGSKCIPINYRDDQLNKGESVCVERCVKKYFETLELVSKELADIGSAATNPGGISNR